MLEVKFLSNNIAIIEITSRPRGLPIYQNSVSIVLCIAYVRVLQVFCV